MVMLALFMLLPGFAVALVLFAVAQVVEHLVSMLVGKCNLLHQPAVHNSCFELGSPILRASGMPPGHIPGKIGVGESGDSHLWRW